MDDINSFIEPLFILKNQILPGIYPVIYLLHLYPELRYCAVQEALRPCRMKAKQDSRQTLIKERVIH
jgi:hypothetical protein